MTAKVKPWIDVRSPLQWIDGQVHLLDQRVLPMQESWLCLATAEQVARAIQQMVVRGAPAIGCTAALGLAAEARLCPDEPRRFAEQLQAACELLQRTRPTAVNLGWAIDRQRRVLSRALPDGVDAARHALEREALDIWREDVAACRAMGRIGAELLPDDATVLTHCNTGALATAGYGTALGVIRAAHEAGKRVRVLADETRPFLQGARLTAWELSQDGIDVTVICDNAAGALMQQGAVDCVVVGTDRVARNGDVANKIGTYSVAVLAQAHGLPFYVAAPRSTIDAQTPDGQSIPIEQRPAREVTHIGSQQVVPDGVAVHNQAFDITPHRLIAALITEVGLARPPSLETIQALLDR